MVSCASLRSTDACSAVRRACHGRASHASTGARMSAIFPAPRARLAWLVLFLAVAAGVVGCTAESGGYNTTSPPKIRFFNAAFDIGTVDVDVGNIATLNAL